MGDTLECRCRGGGGIRAIYKLLAHCFGNEREGTYMLSVLRQQIPVRSDLYAFDQFWGLAGSEGPSHVTFCWSLSKTREGEAVREASAGGF